MRSLFQLLRLRSNPGSVSTQQMSRSMLVGFSRSRETAGLKLMSTGGVGNGSRRHRRPDFEQFAEVQSRLLRLEQSQDPILLWGCSRPKD